MILVGVTALGVVLYFPIVAAYKAWRKVRGLCLFCLLVFAVRLTVQACSPRALVGCEWRGCSRAIRRCCQGGLVAAGQARAPSTGLKARRRMPSRPRPPTPAPSDSALPPISPCRSRSRTRRTSCRARLTSSTRSSTRAAAAAARRPACSPPGSSRQACPSSRAWQSRRTERPTLPAQLLTAAAGGSLLTAGCVRQPPSDPDSAGRPRGAPGQLQD